MRATPMNVIRRRDGQYMRKAKFVLTVPVPPHSTTGDLADHIIEAICTGKGWLKPSRELVTCKLVLPGTEIRKQL